MTVPLPVADPWLYAPAPQLPGAACKGHVDPELWFASPPQPGWRRRADEAKALCRGCPHVDGCAEWAMEQPELWGIWGGLSAADRDRLRVEAA